MQEKNLNEILEEIETDYKDDECRYARPSVAARNEWTDSSVRTNE